MKIAIWNCFEGCQLAENELVQRLQYAAQALQWSAVEVSESKTCEEFSPDFILELHFQTAKQTPFPTYGCMWNPPSFFATYESLKGKDAIVLPAIASYDLLLYGSGKIHTWFAEQLLKKVADQSSPMFYPSCNRSYHPPSNLDNPILTYIGVNWGRQRYYSLFKTLDKLRNSAFYGPKRRWSFIRHSYRGSLPFDGKSVLEALHHHGVGLCLHRPEHTEFAVPSMRIFEIIAAGAVAICGEHPFIRQWFGDTVLYVDPVQEGQDLAAEIDDRLGWIRSHPQQAREMVAAAQAIFNEHLCLEKLLTDLVPEHRNLLLRKYFLPIQASTLQNQDMPLATVILSHGAKVDAASQTDPRVQIIKSNDLSKAIAQTITPYIAIFSGTWQLFPNHFAIQISYLENHPEADIICSDANSIQGKEGLPQLQTYLIRTAKLQNLTAACLPGSITPEDILWVIAQNLDLRFTYDLTAQLYGQVARPIVLRPALLLPDRLPNSWLRQLYLKLSGGGASNSNPNAIARMLIALRDYLSNQNIT